MACDTLIFGTLTLPDDGLEAWLTTPTRPAAFRGWPEAFTGDFTACSPEVLMEQLASLTLQPHELFDLQREGTELSVRGSLCTDSFFEALLPLATLWRSAQDAHGVGSLQLFGQNTLDFAWRVEVGQGRSGVAVLSDTARKSAKKSRQWKQVDAHAQASLRALMGDTGRRRKGSPFFG